MDLDALLRRQNGVLSLDQARACGLSDRTIERRVAAGRWVRLHPRVYLVSGYALDTAGRIRAASLWLADDAVVSGPAAAYWHGMLDRLDGDVDATIPARLHRSARPGVRIRRRDLSSVDRCRRRGLWVTAIPLTALETAARLPDGAAFLDRALQRYTSFADVHAAYNRMLGAHGSARAGRLLRAAADRANSEAERLLLGILREGGVAGWVLGHPFGPWTIDLAFVERRLAIEFDGWAWHTDRDRFVSDRRKGNALVGAGWTLLRFTWADLTERPDRVLAQVRSALKRAA
ncbi:type IV toxin-antitoxin system AbiEi family antitoxin domain-containing protein [Pseudonocardia sp. RS11V-5]|uniref:type IV toxin-antitoxin system AbiEi family antitoxin domain-containing protein n=1 Tax=Pseudonocardia terrae TaxID=2905831 RepID=UPI001E32D163|nr:type IV toxin-antitoxin system AbiEi family antitoxin domain-containing protein [Pseudonocardia terrae]MCE3555230.1 type IV toxin-antitoxin system AbiEi family antitoxin domain-containing protein [Pseudonocardia terrae]